MHLLNLSLAVGVLGVVSATPVLQDRAGHSIADYIRVASTTPAGNTTSIAEPCARVSQAQAQGINKFDVSLATKCLRSVPLDVEGNLLELQGVRTLVQFQSTLAFLEDPPEGYLYPGVDIIAGLDALEKRLHDEAYNNEYDFQLDLYSLIASAYDGHFAFRADIVNNVFGWIIGDRLELVSVSNDSVSLPEIYTYDDILTALSGNSTTRGPSAIMRIDGLDVEAYLNNVASQGNSQDPDANYNSVFPIIPLRTFNLDQGFSGRTALSIYPPASETTTVEFANGTTRQYLNYAVTPLNFTGVTDGTSFFNKFCTPNNSTSSGGDQEGQPSNNTTQVPYKPIPANVSAQLTKPAGYPQPIALLEHYGAGGFFPSQHRDLAVLTIPTFTLGAAATAFENTVRQFLATAKSANKSKLIIDLRGNPGGDIFLAFDLYKQLFPGKSPLGLTNLRASNILNDFGEAFTDYFDNYTYANSSELPIGEESFFGLFLNGRGLENATGEEFENWQSYFGPDEINGGNFTTLQQYNLSSEANTASYDVYGYSVNDTRAQPQTFASENIVMLLDGFCASTCTIFAELMKNQAGVKQVVVGGRKQTGPMQGVGGVKGANVQEGSLIYSVLTATIEVIAPEVAEELNNTYSSDIVALEHALERSPTASINLRNNIRPGDDSATPLQFVYEAADCRFFYTAAMYLQQSLVWSKAYQVTWRNGTCVAGSTGQPSSLSDAGEVDQAPPSNADNFFGANKTSVYPTGLGPAVPSSSASESSSSSSSSIAVPPPGTNSAPSSSQHVMVPLTATVLGVFWALF
ncbi:hypothetical protein K431DRAFT_218178 [Polychaeton citri CBS 116435]|uniref:Tail specific protease domain-containing protein n=1 Tax=Polychaeton citri CBS 116435 TaxID=1314669 RepID=A0A9P4QG47_9PEZI|nr:hypothetical protein K431DRAFT_218178 [Polychaeton citri CBS 116435]